MRSRAALPLLLISSLLMIGRAAGAEPIVFVVDARPEKQSGSQPAGTLGILGVAVGDMAQRAVDRKAAEIAAQFYGAVSFDVLDAVVKSIPPPSVFAGGQAEVVGLRVADETALAGALKERGAQRAILVHYLAVPDRRFWSQLRVQRVTATGGTLTYAPLVTAYYVTALPEDERHGRDGWTKAAVARLESEVRASFAELAQMWARIAADAGGVGSPQPTWQTLPVLPEEQDDWTFRCRGITGCKLERLVKLTSSRAWISAPEGAVLASIDRATASQAPNFIAIPIASGMN